MSERVGMPPLRPLLAETLWLIASTASTLCLSLERLFSLLGHRHFTLWGAEQNVPWSTVGEHLHGPCTWRVLLSGVSASTLWMSVWSVEWFAWVVEAQDVFHDS